MFPNILVNSSIPLYYKTGHKYASLNHNSYTGGPTLLLLSSSKIHYNVGPEN